MHMNKGCVNRESVLLGSEQDSVGVAGEVRQAHHRVLVPSRLLRLLLALQIPHLRLKCATNVDSEWERMARTITKKLNMKQEGDECEQGCVNRKSVLLGV